MPERCVEVRLLDGFDRRVDREGEALRLRAGLAVDSWAFADAATDLLRVGAVRDEGWIEAAHRARVLYRPEEAAPLARRAAEAVADLGR